ncbi:MAG TPA: hypothetical protein VK456_17705 [Xanthobacteraceae bacterium]|nr:hypothetical protein [Xanthobacteraceae bacterium]
MGELLTKADLSELKADLRALKADLASWPLELESHLEAQTRQLTIRYGVMLAVGYGALAAFLKLT